MRCASPLPDFLGGFKSIKISDLFDFWVNEWKGAAVWGVPERSRCSNLEWHKFNRRGLSASPITAKRHECDDYRRAFEKYK